MDPVALKIYNAVRILNEMLTDRGYNSLKYIDHFSSLDTFGVYYENYDIESFKENLNTVVKKNKEKLSVVWVPGLSLNVNIRFIHSKLESEKCTHAILIYQDSMTPGAKSVIANSRIFIDAFSFMELQFNITKHELNPKFIVCDKEFRDAILKEYGCKKDKIPQLKYYDPIRKYYGLKHGDMIKTIRNFDTDGQDSMKIPSVIGYRIVE